MIINQNKKHHSFKEPQKCYDRDEGFSQDQCEHIIIYKQRTPDYDIQNRKVVNQGGYLQPKLKLKLLHQERVYGSKIQDVIRYKQQINASSHKYKSLQIKKKDLTINHIEKEMHSIIKTMRTMIGQNILMKDHYSIQNKAFKQVVINNGGEIAYQKQNYVSTHGFIRTILQNRQIQNPIEPRSFIKSKYNNLIRQKIKDSLSISKQLAIQKRSQSKIQFNSNFQCGNLQFAAKVGTNDYDLYMSIDTNTLGHQNWFYFRAKNTSQEDIQANLRICNFKRQLKMFQKGAKIYSRDLATKQGWVLSGQNFVLKQGLQSVTQKKIYKLSFRFSFKANHTYELSLLPAYSYSQMMKDIEQIQQKPNVLIQILSYSLTGLVIPIITLGSPPFQTKNLILISSRVHPGQTVGSYIVKGLLNRLTDNSEQMCQFFKNNVVKVIPMSNPDGVIFGNFRTNFLGTDLNRSFLNEDDILYPQVYAIKELGKKLKSEYKDKFNTFIDLHGHSSKKNVFSYGPDYDHNHTNFYSCRLLPKILQSKSKYFKFSDCTFKLEEYKQTTARAYFINNIGINGYTIEASYSLYDFQNQQHNFHVQDWINFGTQLAESIAISEKMVSLPAIKNHFQLKKVVNSSQQQEDVILLKRIQKDIKKQVQSKQTNKIKQIIEHQDSDCQNQSQDLKIQQRRQIEKKITQRTVPQFFLPRVLKQPIIYPTVTPKLFHAAQKQENGPIKLLYTKRNKYCALRMMNISNTSGNLVNQISQIDSLNPYVKNMKLQNRFDF